MTIVKNMKSTKSSGYDEKSPFRIQTCSLALINPLYYLTNKSSLLGKCPDLLILTIVKPINKKGDPIN